METPDVNAMLELITRLADTTIDGDIVNGEEWLADGNDDEVDMLYEFVGWARALLGRGDNK